MQDIKDVLVGLLAISALLAEEFKDGVQASDIADIIVKIQGNEELKQKIILAYNEIDKVPSDLKSLTLAEGLEIVAFAIPEIVKLVGAIKK